MAKVNVQQSLSALSAVSSALSLTNLVLINPANTIGYQPKNAPSADGKPSTAAQPEAFVFNYEGENRVNLKSDITDHYVENNTAIQDQIALKPEVVTVQGYIGEVNDIVPSFLKIAQVAATKLTAVNTYQPGLSATALIAYTDALLAYEVAQNVKNAAESAWSSLGNIFNKTPDQLVIGSTGATNANASLTQNKQQVAFQKWYLFWQNKVLFNIQTPWAVFTNMAIQDLEVIQDESTRMITDFKITFKLIRTANTITQGELTPFLQGRLNSQASSATNIGSSSGNAIDQPSVSSAIRSMGGPF